MRFAGIDIGSRSIELVVVDDSGQQLSALKADTGFDPVTQARKMISKVDFDLITATGYGRTLFELAFDAVTVTEIKAHATAVHKLFPDTRTILDIGGQDSKAIALFDNGRVKKFEMNDRCAAGTGKFLEIMATNLGFSIDEFGLAALETDQEVTISSMCTVFAESEVTSLIAQGKERKEIARGLHDSAVRRAAAMIQRVSAGGDIVFTGGVAQNPCMVSLLKKKLKRNITIPLEPQFMGAYGAALVTLSSTR